LVLKKSKKDNKTLFIDAAAEFTRGNAKNTLSDANRRKILDAYIAREDIEHFAKLVDNSVIGDNDYNIAVSSYVEQKDTRKVVDITELNTKIATIVSRQQELRSEIDKIVAEIEGSNFI
jgi:type I restriction enzyme M protein